MFSHGFHLSKYSWRFPSVMELKITWTGNANQLRWNWSSVSVNYIHWQFNAWEVMVMPQLLIPTVSRMVLLKLAPCNHRLSGDEKWFLIRPNVRAFHRLLNKLIHEWIFWVHFIFILPVSHFAQNFVCFSAGAFFDLSITVCFQLCFRVA